tara:strand:- start:552 stop:854 length:303 start_codon:yes stop_codon:yes gene_type:complete
MEKRFLKTLKENFPNHSFKLVRKDMSSALFGYTKRETVLVDRVTIKISWTPFISECDEFYFQQILFKCLPEIREIVIEKKKRKSTKILDNLRKKYANKKK